MISERIRVLIADDHEVVRRGLDFYLSSLPGIELVGEATDGAEAIRLSTELKPDVILMDVDMPGINGIAATRHIKSVLPDTHVIVLTVSKDEQTVAGALQAGVSGYALKSATLDELLNVIHVVLGGHNVFAPEATRSLISPPPPPNEQDYNLTEREHEVLTMLSRGMTNIEIAEHLFVSPTTIKFHLRSIFSKLRVKSRTEAVALAHQHRLVN